MVLRFRIAKSGYRTKNVVSEETIEFVIKNAENIDKEILELADKLADNRIIDISHFKRAFKRAFNLERKDEKR